MLCSRSFASRSESSRIVVRYWVCMGLRRPGHRCERLAPGVLAGDAVELVVVLAGDLDAAVPVELEVVAELVEAAHPAVHPHVGRHDADREPHSLPVADV